ncbi:hypothetical protein Efla_001816 [Eimeria flavescens]
MEKKAPSQQFEEEMKGFGVDLEWNLLSGRARAQRRLPCRIRFVSSRRQREFPSSEFSCPSEACDAKSRIPRQFKKPQDKPCKPSVRWQVVADSSGIARGSSPYVFVGYSMGAWVAYEALCVASKEGLPLPTRFIAAAMVSPNLPAGMRPWKCTSSLDTAAFQDQLRAWSCNEILFHPEMWAAYEPLLRADHRMLDSYKFTDMKGELKVPCSVFRGHEDKQLADDALFVGWFEVLGQTGNEKKAEVTLVEGDHGLVFNAANRQAFFKRLTDLLDSVLLAIEYGQ